MITGKEHSALGNTGMIPDGNISKVIDPCPLPYPNVVSDAQPPGIFYSDVGFNDHPLPHFCTKKPQPENPDPAEGIGTFKKTGLSDIPEHPDQNTGPGIVPGIIVLGKIRFMRHIFKGKEIESLLWLRLPEGR